MKLNTQLNALYDYSTEQLTCAWQVKDGGSRTADFSFSIGMDFDRPTYRAIWRRPDRTTAVLDQTVSFEKLSLADKARALLIGEAASQLDGFRTMVYERLSGSRILREKYVQEYMGGELTESTGPLRGELEIRKVSGIEAFEAFFQEMSG